jgi:hypothetical protein
MGGLEIMCLSANPNDPDHITWYRSWLYSDEEAAPLPCARRTVIDPPLVLVARMIRRLCQFVQDPGLPAEHISEHLGIPQLHAEKINP